jgi:hypothetical protein
MPTTAKTKTMNSELATTKTTTDIAKPNTDTAITQTLSGASNQIQHIVEWCKETKSSTFFVMGGGMLAALISVEFILPLIQTIAFWVLAAGGGTSLALGAMRSRGEKQLNEVE